MPYTTLQICITEDKYIYARFFKWSDSKKITLNYGASLSKDSFFINILQYENIFLE